MTFEEVRNLQITNIISNASELKHLMKQCLSIVESSTAKDDEIVMWINSAISDMKNIKGIDVVNNISDGAIQAAISQHVKGHFGNCSEEDKQLAIQAYDRLCNQLSLSSHYRLGG